MDVQANLQKIKAQLSPKTQLLAVSKTKPESLIREAHDFGQMDFGENKVQDLLDKAESLKHLNGIRWHFIGHLQSNKINMLLKVPHLYAIHSVDSLKLLDKLLSKEIEREIRVFLQVNTSGENEKSGFETQADIDKSVEKLLGQKLWKLTGLMTIGSIRSDDFEASAKASFKKLNDLKADLDHRYDLVLELSMGMSQDFLIAQEFGSSWVRIGSQIFGSRT